MEKSTKEILLEKSEDLFAKNGYLKTKVEDITKASGVAKGTFYLYFKSKDELLLEIVSEIISKHEKSIKNIDIKNHTLEENLNFLVTKSLEFARDNENFFTILINIFFSDLGKNIGSNVKEKMFKFKTRDNERFKEILENAIEKQELNENCIEFYEDVAFVVNDILNHFVANKFFKKAKVGCCDYDTVEKKDKSIKERAELITEICLRGISK